MSGKIPENPRLIALRIKDWPRVELVGQKGLPTCSQCHSTDIRFDPNNPNVWGCAECGLESDAVFVYFRALTCPEDGTILTNAGNSKEVTCPRCNTVLRKAAEGEVRKMLEDKGAVAIPVQEVASEDPAFSAFEERQQGWAKVSATVEKKLC